MTGICARLAQRLDLARSPIHFFTSLTRRSCVSCRWRGCGACPRAGRPASCAPRPYLAGRPPYEPHPIRRCSTRPRRPHLHARQPAKVSCAVAVVAAVRSRSFEPHRARPSRSRRVRSSAPTAPAGWPAERSPAAVSAVVICAAPARRPRKRSGRSSACPPAAVSAACNAPLAGCCVSAAVAASAAFAARPTLQQCSRSLCRRGTRCEQQQERLRRSAHWPLVSRRLGSRGSSLAGEEE